MESACCIVYNFSKRGIRMNTVSLSPLTHLFFMWKNQFLRSSLTKIRCHQKDCGTF